MRFEIHTTGGVFLYDNMTSELVFANGDPVSLAHIPHWITAQKPTSKPHSMAAKTKAIKKLKIQLGLSCNYSCEYCSQRFVPHAEETNKDDIVEFLSGMSSWFDGDDNVRVEFWGGEPLVYWKTLKPLAEALRQNYPSAEFFIVTNGSLLDFEKNAWFDSMGFSVGVSHDGPGQHVRGPDPLDDPKKREAILDLYQRLHPKGQFSFNAMLNKDNMSRAAISKFFVNLTGNQNVQIGESSFIDPYDDGGLSKSLTTSEMRLFIERGYAEIESGDVVPANHQLLGTKIANLVRSIANRLPATLLGQKCGMDRQDNVAVDLRGNILTCQNVSAASVAPNGRSHKIGTVANITEAAPITSTHWRNREGCVKCPVLHLCGGSCMFLEGDLWETACDNSFADNVVLFAWAIRLMTGFKVQRIIGGHKNREDIWNVRPTRSIIPIRAISHH